MAAGPGGVIDTSHLDHPASSAVDAGFDIDRLARLDGYLDGLVRDHRIPGYSVFLSRRGVLGHHRMHGLRDLSSNEPVETDTMFRIYSMTKPVTAVAAMMLYEEGAFELTAPLAAYLPSFGEMRVFTGGSADRPATVRAATQITIRQLLTHTAGLTYGFHRCDPVDELYRRGGFDIEAPAGVTLAEACEFWAAQPLLFEPGTDWNYSVATDVVGRVIEVVSGMSLAEFFSARIFDPLGMAHTAFSVSDPASKSLARLYTPGAGGGLQLLEGLEATALSPPAGHFGGGGLVSTGPDYLRFLAMLRSGRSASGEQLLSPRTIAYMNRNHLPGGADLAEFGRPLYADAPMRGLGFGLSGTVMVDPVRAGYLSSPGEYGWGGAASTFFWVDPQEDLSLVFLTQLLPSVALPIRPKIHQLVYQALVD